VDEKTTNELQGRMLTMKITYERLNKIIEEEVVKFKRLNEQEVSSTTINTSIDNITDITKIKTILKSIIGYLPEDKQVELMSQLGK
jgi:hypothetical protein